MTTKIFKQQVMDEVKLSEETKKELIEILEGKRLVPLSSDALAKKIFSPDVHPERFDYLVKTVMNDKSIQVVSSATNEPPQLNEDSKKAIFDVPGWLSDGRYANIEIQVAMQDFFMNRVDVYCSHMLMLQYARSGGKSKSEVNIANTKGIILVFLMLHSPAILKNASTNRYIHRITKSVTDSGLEINSLRQIAYVQLDKALEQFMNKSYNNDEDEELLILLAMIADINNKSVVNAAAGNEFMSSIYRDVEIFSKKKEIQRMLFEEELAKADWNALKQISLEEGREEGREEGLREGVFGSIKLLLKQGFSQEEIVSELLDIYLSLSKDAVQKYLDDYLKEQ